MTMHQRRRRAGSRRNQERKEVKPEEYTIYERVPALSPGSFDERHMRRNLRITKLYGSIACSISPAPLLPLRPTETSIILGAEKED